MFFFYFPLYSILHLRKICNHPSLLGDRFDPSSLPGDLSGATFEEQGSKLAVVSYLLYHLNCLGSEKIVLVSISTQVGKKYEKVNQPSGHSCETLVWRDSGVYLKSRISRLPEQTGWLYTLIAPQQHSPHPRRFYQSENWLGSRCLT